MDWARCKRQTLEIDLSVWATSWAWQQQTVTSPGQLLVLLALADFSNDLAVSFASQRVIAQMTRLAERTVRQHLADLELAGLMRRTPRRDKSGHFQYDAYQLNGGQRPELGSTNCEQPGDDRTAEGGANQPAADSAGGAVSQRQKTAAPAAENCTASGKKPQPLLYRSEKRSDQEIHRTQSCPQPDRRRPITHRERRYFADQEIRPLTDAEAKRGLQHIKDFLARGPKNDEPRKQGE